MGKQMLEIGYEDVEFCSQGLILVERLGEWDYIGMTGKEIIDIKLENASEFKHGLAIVEGKYGCKE